MITEDQIVYSYIYWYKQLRMLEGVDHMPEARIYQHDVLVPSYDCLLRDIENIDEIDKVGGGGFISIDIFSSMRVTR